MAWTFYSIKKWDKTIDFLSLANIGQPIGQGLDLQFNTGHFGSCLPARANINTFFSVFLVVAFVCTFVSFGRGGSNGKQEKKKDVQTGHQGTHKPTSQMPFSLDSMVFFFFLIGAN